MTAIRLREEEIHACDFDWLHQMLPHFHPSYVFWVGKLTGQNQEEVDTRVDNEVLVTQRVEPNRSDFGHDEVEQPRSPRRHRRDGHTGTQRRDLRGVEEGQSEESRGEKEREHEDEASRCSGRRSVRTLRGRSGHNGHTRSHASCSKHHQLSPSETIDRKDTDGGAQRLPRKNGSTQDSRCGCGETEILLENGGLIEGQRVDPGHLLEQLTRACKTCSMEKS